MNKSPTADKSPEQEASLRKARYYKKTNIGVGSGMLLQILGAVVFTAFENGGSAVNIASLMMIGGLFLFVWGTSNYVLAKGRSPAWTLLGFGWLLGLIILVFLKDRSIESREYGVWTAVKWAGFTAGSFCSLMFLQVLAGPGESETWSRLEMEAALAQAHTMELPSGRFTYSNIVAQTLGEMAQEDLIAVNWTPEDLAKIDELPDEDDSTLDWIESKDPRAKKKLPFGVATAAQVEECEEIAKAIGLPAYWKHIEDDLSSIGLDTSKLSHKTPAAK